MSVRFKSRLNPWYLSIPSNPNLYSTKIIMEMRWQTIESNVSIRTINPRGGGGGGVLGPKIAGGVPRATENWTQKDRGKNGILGPKRSNFARICTQKIVFVLVDEKKHPKKIVLDPAKVKKGVKTAAHMYHPSHREYPPPPPPGHQPHCHPVPRAYDCVAVYIVGRRTNLVV